MRDHVTMATMSTTTAAMDLRGKTAVITGGAGGIGQALARRFGREGMNVVLADVLAEPLEQATRALTDEGVEALGVLTDVTDYGSVESLAAEALARFGAVHVVCNNAGTGGVSEGYLWEHDLADWRWGIDVNVLGVIHGIKAFTPLLVAQGEGHVVNTCSGNGGFAPIARGAMGGPATAVYPMTKAAVLCLTESLYTHLEMTGTRVRAHVLFPGGFLNTGIWESWRHRPQRYAATQRRRTPESTLAGVVARFTAAGARVEFTPLDTVAGQVIDGLREDRFWMMGPPGPADQVVSSKAASILARGEPDYLVDVLGDHATEDHASDEGGKRRVPAQSATVHVRRRRGSTTRSTPPKRLSPPRRSPSPTSPTPTSSPPCCPSRWRRPPNRWCASNCSASGSRAGRRSDRRCSR